MSKTQYKATIHFDAYEDSYEQGELDHVNSWTDEIVKDTKGELQQAILDATYQDDFSTVDDEQMNDYDWCTEYHTTYLANEDNQGDASKQEIEQWKKGEIKLYAINCHILVTKITETKSAIYT